MLDFLLCFKPHVKGHYVNIKLFTYYYIIYYVNKQFTVCLYFKTGACFSLLIRFFLVAH